MRSKKRNLLLGVLVAFAYAGSFTAIKVLRPECLTSNAGPGSVYCAFYYPLRFVSASLHKGYWRRFAHGHWCTLKYTRFNPGNGYCDVENLAGEPGRVWLGWDPKVKEGEVLDVHFTYRLETWDDFSDQLIDSVDYLRRKNSPPFTES
jgi:hypothetical protein